MSKVLGEYLAVDKLRRELLTQQEILNDMDEAASHKHLLALLSHSHRQLHSIERQIRADLKATK